MSRGGLLLRQARDGVELDYVPIAGAVAARRAAAEAAAAPGMATQVHGPSDTPFTTH